MSGDQEICQVNGVTSMDETTWPAGTYVLDPSGTAPFVTGKVRWASDDTGTLASKALIQLEYTSAGHAIVHVRSYYS